MWTLYWRTIKDRKWTILIYSFVGVVLLWMYIVLYPSVQSQQASVSEFIKILPAELNKVFGLDSRSFTMFEGLVAGKLFSLVWPMMMLGLLVSLASSFLVGKIEKGTMEFLLAQPISRIKIYLTKLLVGVTAAAIFVVFSILSVAPLAKMYNLTYHSANFLNLALVGLAFGLAILGVAMFFAATFSERGKASFTVSGIFLLMYFLNILALIKDSLSDLRYASFFYYFNYTELLLDNKINSWSFVVFLAVFFIFGAMGLVWFDRRDAAM